MGMVAFLTRAGELAAQETRTVTTTAWPGLPDGEYGFVENYCDDLRCDCRRVLINVISRSAPTSILATINYGWESPEFYTKWLHDAETARQAASATLEPFGQQTDLAPALLELFTKVVLQDVAYVERLKRHYQMFKDIIRQRRKLTQKRRRRW